MKVKNKIKSWRILFAIVASLFLTSAANVSAVTKNVTVSGITVKEKSGTITVVDPVVSDNEISSNITFNKKDDFVTFELSLKNNESEKYKIESIEDNNTNNNIQIEYGFSGDYIGTNETGAITVKLSYKNTLLNVDEISINDLTIKIHLISEDGKSDEIIINPSTGDALPYYFALLAIASVVLVLAFKNRKIRNVKIFGILIALSILFIPFTALAKEKYETRIKFTDIDIIGEFETYNITIKPGNGEPTTTVPVKYGDKLTNLPANPSKDGYDFEKWVDGDGNTVTADTVITGPITVEAKYTIKKYSITYDLNGGSLPDGKTNPSEYTIEDEVTVNNPTKQGYTFIGWSGTGIDGKTANLVIPTGSKDARNYLANYSANENTPYTVTHRYQNLDDLSTYAEETVTEYGETGKTIPAPRRERTGFETPSVQNVTVSGDESSHITYTYNRVMCAFSFNNNENVTSSKPADNYPYGTVITLTANDVAGKTFSEWDNGETANPLTITLTGDLTIEPTYTTNTVTVTFNTGDGSAVDSQTIDAGEKATRPSENPTKFNYLFYDWYTTDSYETIFDFNTEITTDTTVYARFVPSSFPTVFEQTGECIFNGSDGVLEGENCAYADGTNKYIDTGIQLYIAENHKKDYEIGFTIGKDYNYLDNVRQATFMNTKLEGNGNPGLVFRKYDDYDQLDLSSRNTSSANIRKLWANQDKDRVVRIYRITNKTTKVQEIFYSMDGGAKVKINDLSRFNPIFDTSVWFGAAPTNTSANVAQRILVGKLSNMYIKLGAYEEPEGLTYTVSLDANGGSVSPASITKDKGDAVGELPTPTNIPAGKEFDGWYTDLGDEGEKVDSSYTPNTGTTLYAKYIDAGNCASPVSFAADPWETIACNINNGNYSAYSVGDVKEVEIDMNGDSTPESYTVRIANMSTPEVCETAGYSQTACGIVIEFIDIIGQRSMNSTSTNEGGWKSSSMATYLNGDFYNKLPSDLQSAIIPTYPIVSGSGPSGVSDNIGETDTTKNKIYLLSGREVGFDLDYDNKKDATTDTRTLDYYTTNNTNAARVRGTVSESTSYWWWLRSADSSRNGCFYSVGSIGDSSTHGYSATNTAGVAPAFRIGTN